MTTPSNTYGIDARTAKERWSHHFYAKSIGIGTPVRGVGYADGRVFRGTPDGHLLALDAKTGVVMRDVVGADTAKGKYYTAAPIAWEGRGYMANSRCDVGAIGHIRAFDAQSGEQIWNYDAVPWTGPGAETWPADKPIDAAKPEPARRPQLSRLAPRPGTGPPGLDDDRCIATPAV